jgi:exodeoxyribonuclease X
MVLRVLDCETTSSDPAKAKVIEIASIDLTKDGFYTNPMHTLVNPGVPIPPDSSAIHHLIDEDVASAPSLAQAAPMFFGADVYIAHNAPYDCDVLKNNGVDFGKPWLCSYRGCVRAFPDLPGYSNQAIRYALGILEPFGTARKSLKPHRASDDILVTGEIAHRLLKAVSFQQLAQWSQEPPLLKTCMLKKHKGTPWSEVPADYLQWILGSDLDHDTKWLARYWLDQRATQERAA